MTQDKRPQFTKDELVDYEKAHRQGEHGRCVVCALYDDNADLGLALAAATQRAERLRVAADELVKMYISNLGTSGEFIACITPESRKDSVNSPGSLKVWAAWDAIRAALSGATPPATCEHGDWVGPVGKNVWGYWSCMVGPELVRCGKCGKSVPEIAALLTPTEAAGAEHV